MSQSDYVYNSWDGTGLPLPAISLALLLHQNQKRKGKDVAYADHLMRVAGLTIEAGASADEVIAAVMHDAVEDQGGSQMAARLETEYGANVARIVLGCTDGSPDANGEKAPWRDRKTAHLAKMTDSSKTDRSILLVSLCDKLDNLGCILNDIRAEGRETLNRFNAKPIDLLWYYQSMTDIFTARIAQDDIALQKLLWRLQDSVAEFATHIQNTPSSPHQSPTTQGWKPTP